MHLHHCQIVSAALAMEALHDGVEGLVTLRQEQRERKDWDAADTTRRALERIRVYGYRVQLDDARHGGTWHWTLGEK
jgi:cysteinyl-tRNA synthetase